MSRCCDFASHELSLCFTNVKMAKMLKETRNFFESDFFKMLCKILEI